MPETGGNILTRKFGPLPAWAWAGLAVGGYLIYRMRKAQTAGTASTPATSTAATAPIAQAPSGYGYQGPGSGGFLGGSVPTGAMSATNAGQGSSVAGVNPSGTSGNYYQTSEGYPNLLASGLGGQTYYQPPGTSGLFVPVTQGVAASGAATGLPLFIGPPQQS